MEVEGLFALLQEYVDKETPELVDEGVRVRFLGEREGLPSTAVEVMSFCERQTLIGTRLNLSIALNYGGRAEIIQAVRKIAAKVETGELRSSDIKSADFENHLLPADCPILTF